MHFLKLLSLSFSSVKKFSIIQGTQKILAYFKDANSKQQAIEFIEKTEQYFWDPKTNYYIFRYLITFVFHEIAAKANGDIWKFIKFAEVLRDFISRISKERDIPEATLVIYALLRRWMPSLVKISSDVDILERILSTLEGKLLEYGTMKHFPLYKSDNLDSIVKSAVSDLNLKIQDIQPLNDEDDALSAFILMFIFLPVGMLGATEDTDFNKYYTSLIGQELEEQPIFLGSTREAEKIRGILADNFAKDRRIMVVTRNRLSLTGDSFSSDDTTYKILGEFSLEEIDQMALSYKVSLLQRNLLLSEDRLSAVIIYNYTLKCDDTGDTLEEKVSFQAIKENGEILTLGIRGWYYERDDSLPDGWRVADVGEQFSAECSHEAEIRSNSVNLRKCLVLDCDGVLWGGTIGEDGVRGVRMSEARLVFQKAVKKLKEKGVILAINSKNNPRDVEEALGQSSNMVLRKSDFAVIKANWQDKAANIEAIAQELNIGIDSLVFFDDSAHERELVRMCHPEVETPDLTDDPQEWVELLNTIFASNTSMSEEDQRRTDLYQAKSGRDQLRAELTSLEEYYHSLDMKAIIREGKENEPYIPRIAQLTQRTNQFNLTTRRYSEGNIKRFLYHSDYKVFSLQFIDKFGDNGIVGVMIVRSERGKTHHHAAHVEIDTFCLSCRAIGLTLERAFMAYVIDILKSIGSSKCYGVYIPTTKNEIVNNLFREFGFVKEGNKESQIIWKLSLSRANNLKIPEWIDIIPQINWRVETSDDSDLQDPNALASDDALPPDSTGLSAFILPFIFAPLGLLGAMKDGSSDKNKNKGRKRELSPLFRHNLFKTTVESSEVLQSIPYDLLKRISNVSKVGCITSIKALAEAFSEVEELIEGRIVARIITQEAQEGILDDYIRRLFGFETEDELIRCAFSLFRMALITNRVETAQLIRKVLLGTHQSSDLKEIIDKSFELLPEEMKSLTKELLDLKGNDDKHSAFDSADPTQLYAFILEPISLIAIALFGMIQGGYIDERIERAKAVIKESIPMIGEELKKAGRIAPHEKIEFIKRGRFFTKSARLSYKYIQKDSEFYSLELLGERGAPKSLRDEILVVDPSSNKQILLPEFLDKILKVSTNNLPSNWTDPLSTERGGLLVTLYDGSMMFISPYDRKKVIFDKKGRGIGSILGTSLASQNNLANVFRQTRFIEFEFHMHAYKGGDLISWGDLLVIYNSEMMQGRSEWLAWPWLQLDIDSMGELYISRYSTIPLVQLMEVIKELRYLQTETEAKKKAYLKNPYSQENLKRQKEILQEYFVIEDINKITTLQGIMLPILFMSGSEIAILIGILIAILFVLSGIEIAHHLTEIQEFPKLKAILNFAKWTALASLFLIEVYCLSDNTVLVVASGIMAVALVVVSAGIAFLVNKIFKKNTRVSTYAILPTILFMPFHPFVVAVIISAWGQGCFKFLRKLVPETFFVFTPFFKKYPVVGTFVYVFSMMTLLQYFAYYGGGLITLIEIYLINLGMAGAKFSIEGAGQKHREIILEVIGERLSLVKKSKTKRIESQKSTPYLKHKSSDRLDRERLTVRGLFDNLELARGEIILSPIVDEDIMPVDMMLTPFYQMRFSRDSSLAMFSEKKFIIVRKSALEELLRRTNVNQLVNIEELASAFRRIGYRTENADDMNYGDSTDLSAFILSFIFLPIGLLGMVKNEELLSTAKKEIKSYLIDQFAKKK
ncbi:MAG: HAD-IIIC family phosphatase, partial [Candidatus Njordarchaeales archaeon]